MTSTKLITIAFSTHRPETLPFAAEQMQTHEAILLEEPETPGFEQMLQDLLSFRRRPESMQAFATMTRFF